jgi:DNA polymerase (family X)
LTPRPLLLRRLRELHVVDEEAEAALERDGIVTLADLELALAEQRAAVSDAAFARVIAAISAEQRPVMLGRAWDIAGALITEVKRHCPAVQGLEVSGSIRRAEPLVQSLVLVGRAADPMRAILDVCGLRQVTEVLHRSARRALLFFEGYEVDVRLCAQDDFGTVMFTTTGPASHVVDVLKRRARRLAASEHDVYTHAGLAYLPPETRHTGDAIRRAESRDVPALVTREDIRGDLHMHTNYSDGRDSLRHMVHAARALGYEYIAITDHSEHAGASRTLTLDDLARQREEIERVREEVPGMAILHGIEADILPSGSLDCPDAVLATLDIVLASLHDRDGQDGKRLTKRCLSAIHHPLVSVITHPANQLVGRREGYDMDYDALYAAAAENGTALEVDGAPSHLDLDGDRAGAAVKAGVTLVIDSDCHRSPALDRQMQMGVATACRGWVESRHVLNTRRLPDVRAFLARKRAGV